MGLDPQNDQDEGMNELSFAALTALAISVLTYLTLKGWNRRRRMRLSKSQLAEFGTSNTAIDEKPERQITTSKLRSITSAILESNYGKWFARHANRAGVWRPEEMERWVDRKVQWGLIGLIIALLLIAAAQLPYSVLALALIGFLTPDFLIINRERARIREIAAALPETIDLISMCVTAGIGFHSGMARVAQSVDNPLSNEFARVLAEMQLGVSRNQALQSLSDRIDLPALQSFVNSVLQVDRLGIPMAKVLEEQSNRMRTLRREQAREQAQKLPVKILAPIMLFLLPALLIIVLGPAVVTVLRSFS